jgi:hypothetical protein
MGMDAVLVTRSSEMEEAKDHVWEPPVIPTINDTATPLDKAAAEAAFGPPWWSPEIAAQPSRVLRVPGLKLPDFDQLPFLTNKQG